ncbi:MAG: hypothetical protein ABIU11_04760, partial [Chitinophagaceae bacterium]
MIGSLLLCQTATAQIDKVELNKYDQDGKPYYFGLSIGVNRARFQTEWHPQFLQNDSVLVAEPVNSGGLALGLSA